MRLLNTLTLKLEEYVDAIPEYVILSHTWADGEVTFEDIDKPYAKDLPGHQKILQCCQQAVNDGFEWVWIDTCCINKDSSAELSEAINSMYNYYWQAEICYAYLDDVPDDDDYFPSDHHFVSSKWFNRGWTLQELLAPAVVEFYGRGWKLIGTKSSLIEKLEKATKIDRRHLLNRDSVHEASIGAIFSWASRRETTRPEDIAYCLLGLVRVNMPLLYGEGRRAFYRLQLELLKQTTDHTIFAWDPLPEDAFETTGILAPSPKQFRYAAEVKTATYPRSIAINSTYTTYEMTNRGLRIALPRIRDRMEFLAILSCRKSRNEFVGIRLEAVGSEQYRRVSGSKTWIVPTSDVFGNYPHSMYVSAESRLKTMTTLYKSPCTMKVGTMRVELPKYQLKGIAMYRGEKVELYPHPQERRILEDLVIQNNEYAIIYFYADKTSFAIGLGQHQYQPFFRVLSPAPFRDAKKFLDSLVKGIRSGARPDYIQDCIDWFLDPNIRINLSTKKTRLVGTEKGLRWTVAIYVREEVWGTPSEHVSVIQSRLTLAGI